MNKIVKVFLMKSISVLHTPKLCSLIGLSDRVKITLAISS